MKLVSSLGVVAVVIVAVAPPVSAQVQFTPSLAAETTYSDNLEYDETGTRSDRAYRLSADLPVTRSWRTGQLEFRYQPRVYRFKDESDFDRTDHLAHLGLQTDISRKTSITFDTSFLRSQSQAGFTVGSDSDSDSGSNPDIVLTQRTNRDLFNAGVGLSFEIAPRWSWRVGAYVGWVRHEPIPGFSPALSGVEDRDYTRMSTGFDHQFSKKATVGFDLRFEENRLDVSGDEKVLDAGLSLSRRVDRKSALALRVGAFSTESMIAGSDDRSGASLRFSYSYSLRRVSLGFFAGHQPSFGGSLPGTSTDSNVGVAIRGLGSEVVFWRLSGQVSRRDSTDPSLPEIDARRLGGNLTWAAHRKVGVRLSATKVLQSEPAGADIEVFTGSLGVVWFPRGNVRGIRG